MPQKNYRRSTRLPQALATGGLLLLIAAVLLLKPGAQAAEPAANPGESAQVQLDRALQNQQPTLAFFHSNNCQQCVDRTSD
ncbi:MAG: hypothetical protein JW726_18745 [Anaerolineales bacterium]|nr:hypothetical protein [Anaerolineales bacterium]